MDLLQGPGSIEKDVFSAKRKGISKLAWHPDGSKIYFSVSETNIGRRDSSIFWIDAEGPSDQKPRRIIGRPGQVFNSPRLSPDALRICFVHYPGRSWAFDQEHWMAEINASGTEVWNPIQLTFDDIADTRCVFSADSRQIFWTGSIEGKYSLVFSMDLQTRARRVILRGTEDNPAIKNLSVSPSGLIAFETTDDVDQIIRVVDLTSLRSFNLPSEEWTAHLPCFIQE